MKKISKFQVFSIFLFSIIFTFFTSPAFAGEWKVKSGDSLSRVAANYPGVTAGEICKANSHMFKVKGCNHIEPGWLLVIPEVGDCFDATMTVASKQKVRDDWNRRVVSNYQDGERDCDFEVLSKKTDKGLLNHDNTKMEVYIFAIFGNDDTYGIGGLFKYSSDYLLSYQFSNGEKGYANQLLFGKYFSGDFAFTAGPRMENDDDNNSDALGLKMSMLYTPKITDSIFGYAEIGISGMRVKEYQINGTPRLSLNGSMLSVDTPTVRKENRYWDNDFNFSVGIAYKF